MTRYARKCSVDSKGLNSGFLFENEMYYCKNEEQAKEYIESLGLNWVKELKLFTQKKSGSTIPNGKKLMKMNSLILMETLINCVSIAEKP